MKYSHTRFLNIRRALWRTRLKLSLLIAPEQTTGQEASVLVSSPEDQTDEAPKESSSALRSEIAEMVERGESRGTLPLLRRALRNLPSDTMLWMSYGNRLQAEGQYRAAFSAFANAVEIDPGNFGALEPYVVLNATHGSDDELNLILSGLAQALVGRSHRHLESLSYSIPFGIDEAVEIVATGGNGIAKGAATLYLSQSAHGLDGLGSTDSFVAETVYYLCSDKWPDAVRSLNRLSPGSIPLATLRMAIRRAQSRASDELLSKMLAEYLRAKPNDRWAQAQQRKFELDPDFDPLTSKFPFPAQPSASVYERKANRVVYSVYNSLPHHSAGYATRTHGLLLALRQLGWDISATSRLEYPLDMPGFEELAQVSNTDIIDGIAYNRLISSSDLVSRRPMLTYVENYSTEFKRFLKKERASLVHAASNHLNGLASVAAAIELGIPSIYEVRGLWEVTRASRDPAWGSSREFRQIVELETVVASRATKVLAITDALKTELVTRGIEADKITVVPNGVDPSRFHPADRDVELSDSLALTDKTVIGYAGSLVDYEGLHHLIEAAALMSKEREDFVVLVVGDGKELENLKSLTHELSVDDCVIFTGRVPHESVGRYLSLIDIAPFPRLPLPVCEMVSPLKPFEAMAMGATVVGSNVGALTEIIEDQVTGLVHDKGSVSSLKSVLTRLLDDPQLCNVLAENGRQWVINNRKWSDSARRIAEVYEALGAHQLPEREV